MGQKLAFAEIQVKLCESDIQKILRIGSGDKHPNKAVQAVPCDGIGSARPIVFVLHGPPHRILMCPHPPDELVLLP